MLPVYVPFHKSLSTLFWQQPVLANHCVVWGVLLRTVCQNPKPQRPDIMCTQYIVSNYAFYGENREQKKTKITNSLPKAWYSVLVLDDRKRHPERTANPLYFDAQRSGSTTVKQSDKATPYRSRQSP